MDDAASARTATGPAQVVVHIGMGKTGTSSIQFMLAANRPVLAAHGVLFPRVPGRARHTRLGLAAKSDEELRRTPAWHRLGQPAPHRFRRRFRRRLRAEVDEAGAGARETVLFSDEALFGLDDDALLRLRKLLGELGARLRVVAYLRRQDDHLASLYQQEVKVGETRRIEEWVAMSGLPGHDYHARLSAFRDVLAPDELVVRRFERSSFLDGSLYADFLHAAGIAVPPSELVPPETRNESLDAETIEFLRILNLHRVDQGAQAWLINNLDVVDRLRQHPPGPTLTLPGPVLDAVMDRWADSNRATAREFVGDPTGELFREARREDGTTTEQRLDPARTSYFAELLELPAATCTALTEIAEREARRTGAGAPPR